VNLPSKEFSGYGVSCYHVKSVERAIFTTLELSEVFFCEGCRECRDALS